MIRSHFKGIVRRLLKKKVTTGIQIIGLMLGLTGCMLIGLFISDEMQYDTYHPNLESTYRLFSNRIGDGPGESWAGTSPNLGPTLLSDYPEVKDYLRLFLIRSKQLFEFENHSFLEEGGFFAEHNIFNFFHLPLKYGDPQTALTELDAIVISEEISNKLFGEENPVGRIIQVGKKDRMISGVLEPVGDHFHLEVPFLVSFKNLVSQVSDERLKSWVWQDFSNYVQLQPNTNLERFKSQLAHLTKKYIEPETSLSGFSYVVGLQRVDDIYLKSTNFRNDPAITGNWKFVIGIGVVGLFLLLIACVNFINLSTAQAIERGKEIGIRKTTGAQKSQIIVQFMLESAVVVGLAAIAALIATRLLIPYLNQYLDKQISFQWFFEPLHLLGLFGLIVVVILLSGFYPSLVISRFEPLRCIQNGSEQVRGNRPDLIRKILVVVQNGLSAAIIIALIIVYQQVNFLTNTSMGFEPHQLLHFPMKNKLFQDFDATKNEFENIPGVLSASTCYGIPGDIIAGDNIIVPDQDQKKLSARIFAVDHSYINTMGMEVVAGRDFDPEMITDRSEAFVINETAVRSLGLGHSPQEAIGKELVWERWDEEGTLKEGRIIGVVKDFHYNSMHEEIQTSVLHIYPDAYWKLALNLETENISNTIKLIKEQWDEFDTGYPLDYEFVDQDFASMYNREQKLSKLILLFALAAIIVSSIGALGMIIYAVERRRKEIGIRKILGATRIQIVGRLTSIFLKLIGISIVVAAPFSYIMMRNWLNDFAYSIDIRWWVFPVAGVIIVFITLLTVGIQSISAASQNPIKSLRDN